MTDFDSGLETLLELDGEIFPMENGFWTKFEVHRVEPSKEIPHGIKYSITLHNRQNQRIVGFDNAHGVKLKKTSVCSKKDNVGSQTFRKNRDGL